MIIITIIFIIPKILHKCVFSYFSSFSASTQTWIRIARILKISRSFTKALLWHVDVDAGAFVRAETETEGIGSLKVGPSCSGEFEAPPSDRDKSNS